MIRILIFDSGVGGLSISQSLADQLPFAEQVLLSDTACFPYGEMEEETLINRVHELLVKAVSVIQPDCIVVACNTVSTVALEKIRASLDIPVVGVVPAIKPAAAMSRSKVIGLLATPATIKRTYTADLVTNYANDCTLIAIGDTRLVEMAEQRVRGIDINQMEVKKILKPVLEAVINQNLDTIVLGCTHFPLLSDIFSSLLPDTVRLVDSSEAIARQVHKVLEQSGKRNEDLTIMERKDFKQRSHRCFVTRYESDYNLETGLEKFGFLQPEILQ